MIEFAEKLLHFMETHPLIVILILIVSGFMIIISLSLIEKTQNKIKELTEKDKTEAEEDDFETEREA